MRNKLQMNFFIKTFKYDKYENDIREESRSSTLDFGVSKITISL